jgi:exonuclease III
MDMKLGTWNVRSLYRAGLFMAVVKKISKYEYNLDLVGVQEVRWHKDGNELATFMNYSMRLVMTVVNVG